MGPPYAVVMYEPGTRVEVAVDDTPHLDFVAVGTTGNCAGSLVYVELEAPYESGLFPLRRVRPA